jgi:hypothetical protein
VIWTRGAAATKNGGKLYSPVAGRKQRQQRELFFVPEMGPVSSGYNLQQLPNSWEDAIRLRPFLEAVWQGETAG